MKDKLMTLRLPQKVEKEIAILAEAEDSDKSKLIRELIILGIKEMKLNGALRLYSEGRISLGRAAFLADVSLWKMIEIMSEKKITLKYGERELKEDLKGLRE